jgi:hypothetical protein
VAGEAGALQLRVIEVDVDQTTDEVKSCLSPGLGDDEIARGGVPGSNLRPAAWEGFALSVVARCLDGRVKTAKSPARESRQL